MTVARCCLVACGVLAAIPIVEATAPRQAATEMTRAANAFVGGLTADQRTKAQFQFADSERVNWHFIPRARKGLPLKEMTPQQRDLAKALLQAGVSQRGYLKASTIMELDLVLREMGGNPVQRDPELYFFSIFGTPSDAQPWGWRVEGHHLSLNFTVVGGSPIATAPAFMGANPAEVREGTRQGLRVLSAEEDLARELVTSLDASQRATAVFATEAPRDIVTANRLDIDPLAPPGISVGQLRQPQVTLLRRVIEEYLGRMADRIATERRARLEQSDFTRVTFAWAGPIERGAPHYYRIQGPTFLIEFDNVQNGANHIHSVWRDFNGDFGADLLRQHYQQTPHQR